MNAVRGYLRATRGEPERARRAIRPGGRVLRQAPALIWVVLLVLPRTVPAATEDPHAVPARADSVRQSYTLYLPPGYSEDRAWPILYCFDPSREGIRPVELFRASAERSGIIIASTNEFRSDSTPPDRLADLLVRLWNDTHARFPIDPRRVYAAGFSGGGRVCWVLDQMSSLVDLAGIIEVGAGLPWNALPDGYDPSGLSYCGLAGETDPNHDEMGRLVEELDRRRIPHRFVTFEGSHQWPPAEACADALDWMQIEGMRTGRVPPDSLRIQETYRRESQAAASDEEAGRWIEAFEAWRTLAATFRGLTDVSGAEAHAREIEGSKGFEGLRKRRAEERKEALKRRQEVEAVLDDLADPSPAEAMPLYLDFFYMTGLQEVMEKARSADRERATANTRVLERIFSRAAWEIPRRLVEKGEYFRAALALRLATEIKPENPRVWYSLATVRARAGAKGEAVEALGKALDAGFADLDRIAKDPTLDSIRSDPRFQALLRSRGLPGR